jgi:hypothetical protein
MYERMIDFMKIDDLKKTNEELNNEIKKNDEKLL